MQIATVTIRGVSPYSQSRYYKVERVSDGKESHAEYEERTWRERLHSDDKGEVFIPPMAFKNCLSEAAKFLNIQIPGKGKATYTKHFEAGILINEPLMLGIKKSDVPGQWLHVPSDGRRGGPKRVEKCFPVIHEWGGDVKVIIVDETILNVFAKEDGRPVTVFEHVFRESGKFIGLGYFRPRNNGFWGRFDVKKVVGV